MVKVKNVAYLQTVPKFHKQANFDMLRTNPVFIFPTIAEKNL